MEVLTGIITDATIVTNTEVVIDSQLPETDVEVSKSITAEVSPDNYVLSSGGMYGAGFTGAAPTWLLDAIQQELTTGTGSVMSVLQGMQTVIDSLQLGVNQNIAQIESTILSQASLATSVQSQIDANEAAILNVAATRVTPTEAQTIALQVQQSTFGADASAFIGSIASTYVSPTSAIAQNISLLTTELNDVSASISEVSLLTTEVVLNPLWVDDGLGTDPDALGHPKYVTQAIAKRELSVDANGVITGYIAESGTTSNFTINADNFSVKATGQAVASQNPFTVNATTGTISFKGVVDFTSTNAVGTTTIDGSKITTGSITAGQIAANTITSSQLTTGIALINGEVKSSDFTAIGGAGFRLKSNAAGTSADPTIYGAYILGGTLEGSIVKASTFQYYNSYNLPTKPILTSGKLTISNTTLVYGGFTYPAWSFNLGIYPANSVAGDTNRRLGSASGKVIECDAYLHNNQGSGDIEIIIAIYTGTTQIAIAKYAPAPYGTNVMPYTVVLGGFTFLINNWEGMEYSVYSSTMLKTAVLGSILGEGEIRIVITSAPSRPQFSIENL